MTEFEVYTLFVWGGGGFYRGVGNPTFFPLLWTLNTISTAKCDPHLLFIDHAPTHTACARTSRCHCWVWLCHSWASGCVWSASIEGELKHWNGNKERWNHNSIEGELKHWNGNKEKWNYNFIEGELKLRNGNERWNHNSIEGELKHWNGNKEKWNHNFIEGELKLWNGNKERWNHNSIVDKLKIRKIKEAPCPREKLQK